MFVVVWLRPAWLVDIYRESHLPTNNVEQKVVAGGVVFTSEDAAWDWITKSVNWENEHNGSANAYTVKELV